MKTYKARMTIIDDESRTKISISTSNKLAESFLITKQTEMHESQKV